MTILLFLLPILTFCIPYQMFLTSLIRKHMHSYISENNLEPSNQIIVSTGYYYYYYYAFFLWHFGPIPGHGLPLRGSAFIFIGHTTLDMTPLDE